jgi:hypothetical protein
MTQAKGRRGSPSPQVVAGGMGGTVSFLFWTLAAKTFWKGTFDAASLAGLVSATTTLLSAGTGYVKHDVLRTRARPARRRRATAAREPTETTAATAAQIPPAMVSLG